MCEDLDEFQDALDFNRDIGGENNGRLSDACGSIGSSAKPVFEQPFSPAYISLSMQECPSSSLRRDRLTALRRRMREEFGAKDMTPPYSLPIDCDSLSITSETTSLHSWHRRVLAETHTVVVHPSDSLSTRAGPPLKDLPSYPHNHPLPNTYREPDAHSRPLSCVTPSSVAPTFSTTTSPVGPPPNHPPPPLPPLDSARYKRNDLRSPPPLPPRNPSFRLSETTTSLRLTPKDVERNLSNDSVPGSTRDVINRNGRQGHKKTNSLDRGLTLAKSMKAGPFPPPANKSNSLTRQEPNDDEEECARNTAAEGVILQITTKIIGDHTITPQNGELETIASESSSVSSPSSELSRKIGELKAVTETTWEENTLDERTEIPLDVEGPSSCELQVFDVTTSESMPASGPAPDSVSASAPPPLEEVEETPTCSSMDPITRDVERRMSMKRECSHSEELMSEDIRSKEFANSRSSIDLAKTWARSYGSFATGLFRGAFQKMKIAADSSSSTKVEDSSDSEAEQSESGQPSSGHGGTFVRPRKAKKGPFDFEHLRVVQELNNEHTGAVWCIRFSVCGRLMATAGQDSIIRVWAARSHFKYFTQMRERYQQKSSESSGSPSHEFQSAFRHMESFRPPSSSDEKSNAEGELSSEEQESTNLFASKPYAVFKGHTADILDLSWSKNYFILSSGMDRTVKLWHLSRTECLCCFQHVDFVTCVAFLPKDDRYFLSGSLDGKLRMWHIPDKKVAVWNEVPVKFITALTFVKNGKFAVVGTYNGRCFFYTTDQLKYHTVVDVRSTRGRNAKGHKITGLAVHGDKLLVTSNDSRIRMYDVRDKALTCKFRGAQNERSQIRAAFSPDGKHIVCGSEDKFIYLWRTADLPSTLSVRKDRNAMWERVRAHSAPVSVAVFAPKPQVFLSMMAKLEDGNRENVYTGHVIVSADLQGCIKIMVNRPKCSKPGINNCAGGE